MKVVREMFGSYKGVLYFAAYAWVMTMVALVFIQWEAALMVGAGGFWGMLMHAAYRLAKETGEIQP